MLRVAVEVCQKILVDELWVNIGPVLAFAAEQNTAQHTVTVKPVSIPAEILIRDGISSITDIFAASEVDWDGPLI